MAVRKRTLTAADKRAAEKVRDLWKAFQAANPGISQEAAAQRAGMGQSAFSQFLRGAVPMRVTPVVKFAALFGVDPREIRDDIEALVYTNGVTRAAAAALAREPSAAEYKLSPEATEIAHAFEQLEPQSREFIRRQVFIYAVIDKSFPWLRHGKPISKTYDQFERAHVQNMTAQRDLHAQQVGLVPRSKKLKGGR